MAFCAEIVKKKNCLHNWKLIAKIKKTQMRFSCPAATLTQGYVSGYSCSSGNSRCQLPAANSDRSWHELRISRSARLPLSIWYIHVHCWRVPGNTRTLCCRSCKKLQLLYPRAILKYPWCVVLNLRTIAITRNKMEFIRSAMGNAHFP